MHSEAAQLFGIDFPIFAFSHCRDVVVEVSKSGGMGFLGTTRQSPEQLETDLRWIDQQLDGRPYGVDFLFPASAEAGDESTIRESLPEEHREFVADLVERFGIPPPKDPSVNSGHGDNLITSPERARAKFDLVLDHRAHAIASALGPLPADLANRVRARGDLRIVGLAGTPRHAKRHADAGADLIVAVGTEAAGHTGAISTMVLVPQIVETVGRIPVLAAGGIGRGSQVAAAMALGAAGVWTGSIWLTTAESDLEEPVKEKLLAASSADAVVSRSLTGKTARWLRTPWIDAWASHDAPQPLPAPAQGLLVRDAMVGVFEGQVQELMGTAVGQIVGLMTERQTVRNVMYRLVEETLESLSRMQSLVDEI